MANVVRNRLVIRATEQRLKEITAFLMGEPDENGRPRYIDFQKILPVPKALDPTIKTDGLMGWAVLEGKDCLGYSCEEVKKQFDALNADEKNEWLMLGQRYRDNHKEYGYATAVDWCVAFWGTKDNAFNQEKRADNEIWFDTVWSSVCGIVGLLGVKYSDAVFEYTFADDNAGIDCGRVNMEKGVAWMKIPEPNTKEAFDISFEMRPDSRAMYTFDGKTYQYRKES